MINSSQARKLQILSYLEMNEEQDVGQVAPACQITSEAAGMVLLRLFRQGLLKRELDSDNRLFFYSLSKKGGDRLNYLRNHSNSRKERHA
jgi:DNA-binding MarR family transcriptional regulator